jgi:hypothetical protein
MRPRAVSRGTAVAWGLAACVLAGCGDNLPPAPLGLARAFRTPDVAGCTYASPVIARPPGEAALVVTATTEGIVTAYDHAGVQRWQTALPADPGYRAWIGATPTVVDDRHVVVAWQDTVADGETRRAHHAAVLEAGTGAIDPAFPIVTLAATKPGTGGGVVDFLASNNFSRSQLVHARRAGDTLGVVYVSFGNLRDIQPWHGWVFEIDLDAWRANGAGAAIAASLLTTPEADCGPPGESGADDMLCGGGVWAPSGPTLIPRGDAYELWIATGNGLLDVPDAQYANSILRTGRGLAFDPACGAACDPFDPVTPAPACMESCRDLFMPRLQPGDPALAPPGGRCDGLSFLECYAELDLDLGADSPVIVSAGGRELGLLPAKDGAVYLFDAAHLGTLHHRLRLRDFCGTNGGTCTANWAGTMVTRPAIASVDGAPVAIIPTFYFDETNPAGVVALDIVDDGGGPRLRERWSAPDRDSAEAVSRFREHTGRAAVVEVAELGPQVVIADPEEPGAGRLYLIDAATGAIRDRGTLDGGGRKYIEPAIAGSRVFVTSCAGGPDRGDLPGSSHLEAWDLVVP